MYRYQNIQIVKTDSTSDRYYVNNIYPEIPYSENDSYVITVLGDRLDTLAWKYYANAEFWWIITAANPELRKDSLYLEPGIQLRIPQDYNEVLVLYKDQNTSR